MKPLGRRFWTRSSVVAAMAAAALFGTAAQAEGLPPPPPVETWTGFSVGFGGGVAILDADVNARASRTDEVGECISKPIQVDNIENSPPLGAFNDFPCDPNAPVLGNPIVPLFDVNQSATSKITDLSDTGGFFTVRGAYDYQFAPRWVAGVFVDADWYELSAHARQTHTSSHTIVGPSFTALDVIAQPIGRNFTTQSKTTIDTLVSPEWSISVGGRLGWLATPQTLLYVLGAYTHADLDHAQVKVSITDPFKGFNVGAFDTVDGLTFSNSPTNLLVKLPDSVDGFSLGGGGEVKLGGPWAFLLEYRWTHFNGESGRASSTSFQSIDTRGRFCSGEAALVPTIPGECRGFLDFRDTKSQASADYDLDLHTVRAVLTYHFWSGGGYGG